MESLKAERGLIRAGFTLFTLALLTGFAVPAFLNHRMALSAHLTAVLNGLVLIVLGLSWGFLVMSPLQARLTRAAFLFGAYGNWAASCLAAAWGTSRLTPISGAGFAATAWQENVVQGLQVAVTLAILVGALSVVYALRTPRAPA